MNKMKTKEEVIKILKDLKEYLREKYKIIDMGIFGSTARNEQNEKSDIDILVDFKDDADIFDLVGLALVLEDKLGSKVDIVPRRALRKEFKTNVLAQVVPV